MRNLVAALFPVVLVSSLPVIGDLKEFNIEIEPLVSHHYIYDEWHSTGDIQDRVVIVLPEVTLAPGDTFRVNIDMAGDKSLRVINGAGEVGFTLNYLTGVLGESGSPMSSDAFTRLEIGASHNVLNTVQSGMPWCDYESSGAYWFGKEFSFIRGEGAITDGSLFGDFTVEFTSPKMVGDAPFPTRTYMYNSVEISAFLFNTTEDKVVLEVVPEPGTLLLLGLGGLAMRRYMRR